MKAAGRALGIDTSTISRRIAAAEGNLNARLFVREGSIYKPTEAGAAFLDKASSIQGLVQEMLFATQAAAEGMSGPVTMTAVGFMLDYWLAPRLPAFARSFPNVQWKLISDDRNLSFTRREVDFALRLARPTDDAAIRAKKVGELGFSVYGSRKYSTVPRTQWASVPWLTYGDELAALPEVKWLNDVFPAAPRIVKTSSITTLLSACESGVGLALLPCLVGATSNLQKLSQKVELLREIWFLSHKEAGKTERMRSVASELLLAFEESADLLGGHTAH